MKKLSLSALLGLIIVMTIVTFNYEPQVESKVCRSVGCCKDKVSF